MADYTFNCPHCKQDLGAPEDMLGEQIDCPSCGGRIQLPELQPIPIAAQAAQSGVRKFSLKQPTTPSYSTSRTHPCPFCGVSTHSDRPSRTRVGASQRAGSHDHTVVMRESVKNIRSYIFFLWALAAHRGRDGIARS